MRIVTEPTTGDCAERRYRGVYLQNITTYFEFLWLSVPLTASNRHSDCIFIARRLYLKVHSLDSEIQSNTPEDMDDLTNV